MTNGENHIEKLLSWYKEAVTENGVCYLTRDDKNTLAYAIKCCKHFEDIKKDIDSWMLREESSSSEIPTSLNDCISRADALRVAKNEYLRGWHNALCKALREKYSIHCEEGNFSVIQEETITGLGLSMNCAAGKDVESYMSTIPRVTPIRPKGHWKLVQRGKCIDICCSNCKAVRIKEWAYNYTIDRIPKEDIKGCLECADMSYCPYCGSDNREVEDV